MIESIKAFVPNGTITLPSSKSYGHRALIMAFISNKKIIIKDVDYSDDILATLHGLEKLGGVFDILDNMIVSYPRRQISKKNEITIDVKESGSTLRFLIPIATSLCNRVRFIGKKSLFSRPMSTYEKIFKEDGIEYLKSDTSLVINNLFVDREYIIEGNVSSQFSTGIIFSKILNKSKFSLRITEPVVSRDYLNMTLQCLSDFGVEYTYSRNEFRYLKDYFSDCMYSIEKDYSQLAFFGVFAALKGRITFQNMNKNSQQGDRVIVDILQKVGANINWRENDLSIEKNELKPIDIDVDNCIDLGPILFVLCSFIPGKSTISKIERLKIKESDRLSSMVKELTKAGVSIVVDDNKVVINGKHNYQKGIQFEYYNDHRIAMALSIFHLINEEDIDSNNASCVDKSYPNFFKDVAILRSESNEK